MSVSFVKMLREGRPIINSDLSINIMKDNKVIRVIPREYLAADKSKIGYLYERVVGLHYEDRGYDVEYRFHLGFWDGGIDLIAKNNYENRFIQCKCYLEKIVTKRDIENILNKAQKFIHQNIDKKENNFDLVFPFLNVAFPPKKSKMNKEIENDLVGYFYSFNNLWGEIKLNLLEIDLETPDEYSI